MENVQDETNSENKIRHETEVGHQDTGETSTEGIQPLALTLDLPPSDLNLGLDLSSIVGHPQNAEVEKLHKRASSVLKLAQENEKLKAELKAMADRLEAAERRRTELQARQQRIMEPPSS